MKYQIDDIVRLRNPWLVSIPSCEDGRLGKVVALDVMLDINGEDVYIVEMLEPNELLSNYRHPARWHTTADVMEPEIQIKVN